MKKLSAFFLSFVVAFAALGAVPIMAADTSARAISILEVEGTSVTMTKGAVKEFKARAGLALFDGYTVTTGANSAATLNLDDSAAVVMDQKSKVEISKLTSNKLSVSVLSGTVAVNAAAQKTGQSVEIGAGNSTMAIRGTLFTMGHFGGGIQVNMLEGTGDFDGHPVEDGQTLTYAHGGDYAPVPLVIDENSPAFLLKTIIANKDKLSATGKYPTEFFDKAATLNEKIESAAGQRGSSNSSSSSRSSSSSSSSSNNSSSGGNSGNNGGNTGGGKNPGGGEVTPPKTETFTIHYDLNTNETWEHMPIIPDEKVTSSATIKASFTAYDIKRVQELHDYDFVKWIGSDGNDYFGGEGYIAKEDLTLKAEWEEQEAGGVTLIFQKEIIQNNNSDNSFEDTADTSQKFYTMWEIPRSWQQGNEWGNWYWWIVGTHHYYEQGEKVSVEKLLDIEESGEDEALLLIPFPWSRWDYDNGQGN